MGGFVPKNIRYGDDETRPMIFKDVPVKATPPYYSGNFQAEIQRRLKAFL